jgi:hypothetical protein
LDLSVDLWAAEISTARKEFFPKTKKAAAAAFFVQARYELKALIPENS